MMDKILSIIIADDHHYELEGFNSILKYSETIQVKRLINSYHETIEVTLELKPDVLLLDLDWHGSDDPGFDAIDKIKAASPETAILAMTNHKHLAEKARSSRADYVITKGELDRKDMLESRIKDAYKACQMSLSKIIPTSVHREKLTEVEKEVFILMVDGLSNKEIAQKQGVAISTIKSHVSHIFGKLGVDSRAKAVAFMQKNNLTIDNL
jgi:DNA-binding NarL/FixJ family response regulator